VCEPANACGNSVLEAGEGCDDGNTTAGDGCSAACKIETGNPCGPGGAVSCQSGVCDVSSGAPGVCEPANVCGNSVLDVGEGCDDGNTTAGDGCNGSCKVENGSVCGPGGGSSCQSGICDTTTDIPGICEPANTCGNSVLEAGEGCDDGNVTAGDGCNGSCKVETGNPCGPGGSSSCQSGVCDTTGGAPGVCEAANVCGNGKLESGEGCDDGNTSANDGCSAACKIEDGSACSTDPTGNTGNASCESGVCDLSGGAPGVCEPANSCGNSVLETGEGCDDGNTSNGDGCNISCKIESGNPCGPGGGSSCESGICDTSGGAPGVCENANSCGNSLLDTGEGCDDGNNTAGDGCNGSCRIESGHPCGPDGSSTCESGVCDQTSGPPGICEPDHTCGNSKLEEGEGCDDGNTTAGDGCNGSCRIESGNACNADPVGVTGNASCVSNLCDTTSGAPGTCEEAGACGNGKLEAGEGCDDGNATAGDGCDSACKVEPGESCNETAPGATGGDSCSSGRCDEAKKTCEPAMTCDTCGHSGEPACPAECGAGIVVSGGGCGCSGTGSETTAGTALFVGLVLMALARRRRQGDRSAPDVR
ncbi:MAG: DUF4215 domain-containing protein, partial [Myxococcaceae bacterium]